MTSPSKRIYDTRYMRARPHLLYAKCQAIKSSVSHFILIIRNMMFNSQVIMISIDLFIEMIWLQVHNRSVNA